jgi:hypothetical protein
MARNNVLLQTREPGVMSSPSHQHLFDFTPLLEHELMLHPVGVIRERNLVGKMLDILTNLGQEGKSGSMIFTSVVEHPSINLAAPGAHERVYISGVRPKWSWAFGSAPFSREAE